MTAEEKANRNDYVEFSRADLLMLAQSLQIMQSEFKRILEIIRVKVEEMHS